jgi:glutaredoxin domain-containing cysteine-rich protein 1
MCRKFVLHQAMSKEQSIDLRKRETSESVKDESKGSEAAAPAHRNLMKKAESLPTSLVKPPRTWIDMAMGVSRFKLDQSSEDQIKAKLLLQAETSLESTETEIINTWELMEGLDDQMAPQTRPATISSKSPDMEVLSKVSNQPALKLIPRSLSLSSLEGHRILNAGDVVSEVVNTYSTSAGFLNYSEDRDLDEEKCPLGGNHRVVLYLTSLGCIPKTFEDCCSLRAILESFSVWVDERDVSMHAEFRQELRELVDGLVIVPRVFIKGRYVGGLDEVRRLHEDGKLGELLQDLPMVHFRKPCDGCGGVRFVLCPKCRGSCWNITWYGAETVT